MLYTNFILHHNFIFFYKNFNFYTNFMTHQFYDTPIFASFKPILNTFYFTKFESLVKSHRFAQTKKKFWQENRFFG